MAKTLPFVVQPRRQPVMVRVGTENSGIIEIEARGYLTVAEKYYVQQVLSSDKTLPLMLGLSNKIAKKFKKDTKEGYTILSTYLQNTCPESQRSVIDDNFELEVQELTGEVARMSSMREIAQATIMMRSRIDPDWTSDDTMDLDSDLITGLVDLYNKEEAKEYPEAETKASTPGEEYEQAMGKSQS